MLLVIIMNKRFLIFLFLAIVLGTITGKYVYGKENTEDVFQEGELIFLQQGVYTNKENMQENSKRIDPKIVVKEDDKYYVYVGITGKEENAKKLKELYEKMGGPIYQKKLNVSNLEFKNNLQQFDLFHFQMLQY